MLLTLFTLLPFLHLFITGSDGCSLVTKCQIHECCENQNMTATTATNKPCLECLPTAPYCASGQLIKDACNCCVVCAKAEGDECGYVMDACADNLYCDKPPPKTPQSCRIPSGICRKKKVESKPDDYTNHKEGQFKYYIVDV